MSSPLCYRTNFAISPFSVIRWPLLELPVYSGFGFHKGMKLVYGLMEQVIVSSAERCLDPIPLEPPVLDRLVQAKLGPVS